MDLMKLLCVEYLELLDKRFVEDEDASRELCIEQIIKILEI